MSCACTGAIVRFCGHDAEFRADIYEVGGAVVVRANGPITMESVDRPSRHATHHVVDFPQTGFWRPDLGVLVVPKAQCRDLRNGAAS